MADEKVKKIAIENRIVIYQQEKLKVLSLETRLSMNKSSFWHVNLTTYSASLP